MMVTIIFVCRVMFSRFSFAVETRELAEEWVSKDPVMHHYDEFEVMTTLPQSPVPPPVYSTT